MRSKTTPTAFIYRKFSIALPNSKDVTGLQALDNPYHCCSINREWGVNGWCAGKAAGDGAAGAKAIYSQGPREASASTGTTSTIGALELRQQSAHRRRLNIVSR
jgi:hypothetical protein